MSRQLAQPQLSPLSKAPPLTNLPQTRLIARIEICKCPKRMEAGGRDCAGSEEGEWVWSSN